MLDESLEISLRFASTGWRHNGRMVYRFGEFELDTETYELRRAGLPIRVEPQVFGVVAYLVSNADRAVTKDELLEGVWGDAFVSEATLSSRIMSARRALGDSGNEQRWIKTVHGRGFRFVGEVRSCAGEEDPVEEALTEAHDALRRADVGEAERALAHAGRLLENHGAEADETRARWHIAKAQALLQREGWGSENAREHYEEAVRLAEGVGEVDTFRAARYHLATMFELQGRYPQSETLMRVALCDAPEARDDLGARELLACSLFHQGRFAECAEVASRGLDQEDDSGAARLAAFYGEDPRVSCGHWLAMALLVMGDEEEALRASGRATRLAEQPGRIHGLAHSRQQAAMFHQLRRDADLCAHFAQSAVAIGKRQGLAYREAAGGILLGWARAMQGEPDPGLPALRGHLDRILESGALMQAPYFASLVAEVEALSGETDSARERLRLALESEPVARGFFYTAELLRLLAAQTSEPGLLAEARRVGEAQGALLFLTRLPS